MVVITARGPRFRAVAADTPFTVLIIGPSTELNLSGVTIWVQPSESLAMNVTAANSFSNDKCPFPPITTGHRTALQSSRRPRHRTEKMAPTGGAIYLFGKDASEEDRERIRRGAAVMGVCMRGGTVFTTGCTEGSRGIESRNPPVDST